MQVSDTTTKLYKLHGQEFALEAANADPHFYDLNEDSPGTPPRWYLEVGCKIGLQYSVVVLQFCVCH